MMLHDTENADYKIEMVLFNFRCLFFLNSDPKESSVTHLLIGKSLEN